jgi:hypothetical protein
LRTEAADPLAEGRHLTDKDIRPHLEAEGRRVELRADGLVRDVFLKADRSGPILHLNDTDADDALKPWGRHNGYISIRPAGKE